MEAYWQDRNTLVRNVGIAGQSPDRNVCGSLGYVQGDRHEVSALPLWVVIIDLPPCGMCEVDNLRKSAEMLFHSSDVLRGVGFQGVQ